MKSLKVELTYNPYTVKSEFIINGKDIKEGPLVDLTLNKRLQQWVDKLLEALSHTYNTKEIDLVFNGTLLDSEDVKDAVFIYNKKSAGIINISYNTTDETVDDKVTELKALYKEAKEGPFDEFRTEEMEINFNTSLAPEFEVNVIATMSSGKSTVINAMLGKELMPAKNEACTATIAKISDRDDMKSFRAKRIDHQQDMIDDWQDADAKLMEKWNEDANTSVIEIEGNIPAISEKESIRLVLVDTPGPNNSRDSEHRKATTSAISAKNMSMVLYVLNATQLSTDDDKGLLNLIRDAMMAGGREAQDRFIFIANKIDNFDPEKGESVQNALKNVREYLQYNGIANPIVIPASAELTKLIRVAEFEGKDSLTRSQKGNLNNFTELFIEEPEMNMLEHVKSAISKSTYNKINDKLQAAKNSKNEAKQAEILSGIPIVETLLDNFIAKHAIPAKLKDAVDSFSGVMAKAESMKKLDALIEKDTAEMNNIAERLENFSQEKSNIQQAKEFRDRIKTAKYQLSKDSKKSRMHVDNKINDLLDELQSKFDNEIRPSEAKMVFKKAERDCEYLFDTIESILTEDLEKEQMSTLNQFRDDYQKHIAELLEKTFPSNDDFALKDFQSSSMAMPDTTSLLKEATYEKRTQVCVGTERHGFLWLKKRDVYETKTEELVDMSGPWNELEVSIREHKQKEITSFSKVAENNFEEAKILLLKQMDAIDNKMDEMLKTIKSAASDKQQKEKILAENKAKQDWYKNFMSKLDAILAL
ncbi:dynamin family protein [Colwellia sp. BRX8-9]|uniref:dynamin family protein n=1 Tax=Colwellia sp. BRX8-9 TaxID=2759831 RepID=UPI0015F5D5B2|nr:dynamin family protein [Colwellia sp. BRX8-9]MBA6350078.1 dynamin family protein [Colwellia sp. BRX8-9]